MDSMKGGAKWIAEIVEPLRCFSRHNEAEIQEVDIHEGFDSTLMILQHRLRDTSAHPAIKVIREYGWLPKVEWYARQINQVFRNILTNAIDALLSFWRVYFCELGLWSGGLMPLKMPSREEKGATDVFTILNKSWVFSTFWWRWALPGALSSPEELTQPCKK